MIMMMSVNLGKNTDSNHNDCRNDDNNNYNIHKNNFVLWLWLMASIQEVRVHFVFILTYFRIQGSHWVSEVPHMFKAYICPQSLQGDFIDQLDMQIHFGHQVHGYLAFSCLSELQSLTKSMCGTDCSSNKLDVHKIGFPMHSTLYRVAVDNIRKVIQSSVRYG